MLSRDDIKTKYIFDEDSTVVECKVTLKIQQCTSNFVLDESRIDLLPKMREQCIKGVFKYLGRRRIT